MNPRKKPQFRRHMAEAYKRIKDSWRKPKGSQSKVRKRKKGKIKMPSIGYGAPKKLRYLHPCGLREVLVHNLKEVEKVNPKEEAIRISAKVGRRKRIEIMKKAEELGIKVLNPLKLK